MVHSDVKDGKERVGHVQIETIVPNDLQHTCDHPLLPAELHRLGLASLGLSEIIAAHLADLQLRHLLDIGVRAECGCEKLRELLEIHLHGVRRCTVDK